MGRLCMQKRAEYRLHGRVPVVNIVVVIIIIIIV
jgi:hypothetical protein